MKEHRLEPDGKILAEAVAAYGGFTFKPPWRFVRDEGVIRRISRGEWRTLGTYLRALGDDEFARLIERTFTRAAKEAGEAREVAQRLFGRSDIDSVALVAAADSRLLRDFFEHVDRKTATDCVRRLI